MFGKISICTIILVVSELGLALQSGGTKSNVWPQTSFTPRPDLIRDPGYGSRKSPIDIYRALAPPRKFSSPADTQRSQINLANAHKVSDLDIIVVPDEYRTSAQSLINELAQSVNANQKGENDKNNSLDDKIPLTVQKASLLLIKSSSGMKLFIVPEETLVTSGDLEPQPTIVQQSVAYTPESTQSKAVFDENVWPIQSQTKTLIEKTPPIVQQTENTPKPQLTIVQKSLAYPLPYPSELSQSKPVYDENVWTKSGQTKTVIDKIPAIVQQTQTTLDNGYNTRKGGFIPQSVDPMLIHGHPTSPNGNPHSVPHSSPNVKSSRGYKFGYDHTLDDGSRIFRKERADSDNVVRGVYGFQLANGLVRLVRYTADQNGFHPVINSNEPGLLPISLPSDVQQTQH